MRDGPVRTLIKRLARLWFDAHVARRRTACAAVGGAAYELAGACEGCAKCCEEPTILVGELALSVPFVARAMALWQRWVNGFVLTAVNRREGTMAFTCTHFDRETRRCDSYDTRPGMCRDYPRALLDQPAPELFEGCGFRARAVNADGMLQALIDQGIEGEQLVQLKKKLYLS